MQRRNGSEGVRSLAVAAVLALKLPPSALAEPGHAEAAETLAVIRCVECGRLREGDEPWHVYLADIAEACVYCPDCAEREFGVD
jgi:hypothetical protein